MRTHRAVRGEQPLDHPDWSQLLVDAVNKPGVISSAYSAFWNYSVGNQLLALFECLARGLEPGPIHTFGGWLKFNRHVRKGEKAIMLCMPQTVKRKPADPPAAPAETVSDPETVTVFVFRAHWFVLSQTDGDPYVALSVPSWDEEVALRTLGIERIPFRHPDGNCQGYATGSSLAVSPMAYLPHRTLLHETGHIVLGHTAEQQHLSDGDERTPRDVREVEAEAVALICCKALGLPGEEFSRGYLQHWLGSRSIEPRSAQKIFHAADQILRAGRPEPAGSQNSLVRA